MVGGQLMSLFEWGLEFQEPNTWDVIPDMTLRVYDRINSYFACWDIGCPTNTIAGWPKPPNPDYHWSFENCFVELDGLSILRED